MNKRSILIVAACHRAADFSASVPTHNVVDIQRVRMLAIVGGYEDADDLDHLCSDPALNPA
jgi:hypothetical protein